MWIIYGWMYVSMLLHKQNSCKENYICICKHILQNTAQGTASKSYRPKFLDAASSNRTSEKYGHEYLLTNPTSVVTFTSAKRSKPRAYIQLTQAFNREKMLKRSLSITKDCRSCKFNHTSTHGVFVGQGSQSICIFVPKFLFSGFGAVFGANTWSQLAHSISALLPCNKIWTD